MVTHTGASTVLVVEDNPITRKLFRVTLESAGYAVQEASDGHEALERAQRGWPALILQDLRLPDMSGFDLAERLRQFPHASETPIIAISGLISRAEQTAVGTGRFHGFLAKPVEPSHLLEVVAEYLPRPGTVVDSSGTRGRVLVVDDEPVQRKLTAVRLRDLGYAVETAEDGQAALAKARHDPPDAILSDVLMPQLDGFGLCREVRFDPRLAHIPVVLASSAYIEEEDRTLANKMGADALVVRTPDLGAAIEALSAARSAPRTERAVVLTPYLAATHLDRVVRQLERQVAMTASQAQRNATLTAKLSAIDGISRVLARTTDPSIAARDILAICLEAGGVSEGALYLDRPGEPLALRAVIGFDAVGPGEVESFFNHREVLAQLVSQSAAVALSSPGIPEAVSSHILKLSRVPGMVVATIPIHGKPAGALVMGSREPTLGTNEWLSFARTVATQLGQAIALARTARNLDLLLASAGDGIVGIDTAHSVSFANPAAARMLGRSPEEMMGSSLHDLVHVRSGEPQCAAGSCKLIQALTTPGELVEDSFLARDGSKVAVEYRLQPIVEGDHPAGSAIVFRNIADRRRAQQLTTLEATRRQQLQIKDEFLTHVSHELRTPLTAIHEFTTILLDGLAGEVRPAQREYLEIVLRNTDELRGLIDDLLEAARNEMARLTVRPVRLSLAPVVAEAVEQQTPGVHAKGVSLQTDVPPDLPPVLADPARVRQIVGNLVGNAVKFTPTGGRIAVRARADAEPGAVLVTVADSGPGIPPDAMERVFDYMYQGSNVAELTRKGFGIGLHLCQDLVTRMGGRIWVESRVGHGSEFFFTLPLFVEPRTEAS
jgi:PAS domain S-box-containing protein